MKDSQVILPRKGALAHDFRIQTCWAAHWGKYPVSAPKPAAAPLYVALSHCQGQPPNSSP